MKTKVLILQNVIMHYRKPVYDELSKYYEITVLHSGESSINKKKSYNEIITKKMKIGPFFLQQGVLSEVRKGEYDVIIAMFDVRWLGNILAVLLKSNVRFVYWGHRYSKNFLTNKLRDFLMKISDGTVLYGNHEVERIISRGIDKEKIFIAENTIFISNHSDKSHLYKNSFLYVGRAQKRKRIDILLKAFAEIINDIPSDVTIDIIGSGKENLYLKLLSKKLNIYSRVNFHGEIRDNDKLLPFFEKAFAYVSPGPVGLGVLHSLAYGVPVVTNYKGKHGPEFNNLKNDENALLYYKFHELKDILIKLSMDREVARKLGEDAYKLYANKRTIGIMVNGLRQSIENKYI